jgi:hypothetical protein
MNFFNIKGSIIQNSGKISKINNLLLIPIINPSSIDKNEGNKSIYDKTWEILYQVTNKLYIVTPKRGKVLGRYHVQEWTTAGLKQFLKNQGWVQTSSELKDNRIYAVFTR